MSSLPPSSPFSSMTDDELLAHFRRTPMSILPSFMTADLTDFQSQPRARSFSHNRTYRTSFQVKQDELKLELRNARTLVSHDYDQETGESLMIPIPWPRNKRGAPVALGSLQKYCSEHEFLDRIFCFCSAKPGTAAESVKLFVVRKKDSEHYNNPCLGCRNWEKGEGAGCTYFVNLFHFLRDHPRATQDTFDYPVKPRLVYGGRKAQRIADCFPLPKDSTWKPPPRLPPLQSVEPLSSREVQDKATINPFIVDGCVAMADRLFQPPPPGMISRNVRELVPPSRDDTKEMLLELLGRGVQLHNLLRLIGACDICGYIVALCVFPEHDCIRDVVERRADGSWVSTSATASSLSPHLHSVSPSDLEHWFFNTTTPPRPRYPTPPRVPRPFPLAYMLDPTPASSSHSTTTVWPTSPSTRVNTDGIFGTPLYFTPSPPTKRSSIPDSDASAAIPPASTATTASPSTVTAAQNLMCLSASSSAAASAMLLAPGKVKTEEKEAVLTLSSGTNTKGKKRAADDELDAAQMEKKRCIGHIDLTDF